MTSELGTIALIFGLLVVPRALQRYLLPAPLSCIALGLLASFLISHDAPLDTLALLSTLGISSLFLFAGLEVDLALLRQGLGALLTHLVVRSVTLGALAWAAQRWLGMPAQAAILLALALLTPSTGFILESLASLGLDERERFWVTSKAVGGELMALVLLFGVVQSDTVIHLAWTSALLIGLIVLLPLLFIALGRYVVPYAAGSEFSLLVMVGLVAAYATRELGVYYLVGAFIAGLVARLLRERMPALASAQNLHAVRLFASFFVPFYFFYSGMHVPRGALTWSALALGLALTLVFVPCRVASVWLQRRLLFRESARSSLHVATALTPTLVFTLILADILSKRYGLSDMHYGALLVYALATTLLPSVLLSKPFELDATQVGGTAAPDAPEAG
ncbi:MAG: cation:proton antiporter [Burkholderiales bacterium]|nr:cation:proton antiporter [Burkholderiales bacterium]MDE1929386.1 cation:proton antiporter [Burkholderiales bacterium]MDE2161463.1 cation:proton antiporter [Burkholderiales bacterium]MDE2504511.1 cation:proton antiporter [Burkholderiales bacterium]